MRFIRYFLIVLFMGFIPISCFDKAEYPYYSINDMTIGLYKDINVTKLINPVDSVENDSVFLKFSFVIDYIAFKKMIDLEYSCYAMKKPYNGYKGLKDKIDTIYFTSNNVFNGSPAGVNLLKILKTVGISGSSGKFVEGDNYLISILNDYAGDYPKTTSVETLYLSERPADSLKHNFTFKIIFKSGKILSSNTQITWKK